ncbi:uncharacterized protein J3R85_016088, partial [Psidium guajava]
GRAREREASRRMLGLQCIGHLGVLGSRSSLSDSGGIKRKSLAPLCSLGQRAPCSTSSWDQRVRKGTRRTSNAAFRSQNAAADPIRWRLQKNL